MKGASLEGTKDEQLLRLLQEHMSRIEAAAKRVLGSNYTQAMDDLCQEVRLAIWRMLEKGGCINNWEAFIYHCAHKRALDLFKQTRRRMQHEISFDDRWSETDKSAREQLNGVPTDVDYPDEALLLLKEELAKLPSQIRLTVLLRKGDGYTRAEVARMLNCSLATVDYRLRQGLHRLRKRLKQRGLQHYLR